ncbi:hypothetical protein SAMN02745220_04867 [Desulfopila aestuarii DSM 18488]|uniref:Uncharacterized protein n=1 Tax=Desulfopila aestuarii DSM 18488 TaxID=1121416 RepID=A0A1M7YKB7_9BACT|nr:hypothetical protein SAMN02745220_04867 [Desulfopila aestuarii DSM 18488]
MQNSMHQRTKRGYYREGHLTFRNNRYGEKVLHCDVRITHPDLITHIAEQCSGNPMQRPGTVIVELALRVLRQEQTI